MNVPDRLMSECYAADNVRHTISARFIKSPMLFSINIPLSQFYESRLIQTCLSQSVSSKIYLGISVDLLI